MKQHYLPKAAYLRFFEAPGNPGRVWLYRRGQEPTLVSTEKVAKESDLYSFLTPEGELSTEVEGLLGKIEDEARPVLQRINAGKGDLSITAYEESALATFAAFQAARLPARQRETGEMLAQMSSWLFQDHVANVPAFQQQVDDMNTEGKLDKDTDIEHLRAEILSGGFEITPDPKFVMATLLENAEESVATFLMKRLAVLRSESECFLTSDYPVVNMPTADHPPTRGVGFINSHTFMPVGASAGLLWRLTPYKRPTPDPTDTVLVRSLILAGAGVRGFNREVLGSAENFLFAAERNLAIQRLFSNAERPTRVVVHGPSGPRPVSARKHEAD